MRSCIGRRSRRLRPELSRIACPATLLWGPEDRPVNVESSRRKARAIPGAEVIEIAGSGHLPMLERPSETMAAIAAWIDRFIGASIRGRYAGALA